MTMWIVQELVFKSRYEYLINVITNSENVNIHINKYNTFVLPILVVSVQSICLRKCVKSLYYDNMNSSKVSI